MNVQRGSKEQVSGRKAFPRLDVTPAGSDTVGFHISRTRDRVLVSRLSYALRVLIFSSQLSRFAYPAIGSSPIVVPGNLTRN